MVDFIVKRKKIRSETCSRVSLTGCDTTRHDTTRRDTTRNARVSVPLSSDARGEEKGGGKKIRGKRVNEAKRRGGTKMIRGSRENASYRDESGTWTLDGFTCVRFYQFYVRIEN